LLDQAIEEARSLTAQLRPPALYESGLGASLGWLAGWMDKAHGFRVELDLDNAMKPLAEEDAVALFDVARELLLNAVKHSGTGQASVGLSAPDKDHVLLSVSDKGKGFDVSALSHPQTGNVGFGLFSIQERVAAAGGRFEARSAPGAGTTVELLWPRTAATGAPPEVTIGTQGREAGSARPSGSLAQPARPGQITVVLVEDHALVRQTLADALDRQPDLSVVAESADGEQAVEAVETYRPQVVVMDVNMPKLNGVQATRIVKKRFPEVQVVGLTVHDDLATRQAMLDAGASACLSKNAPVEVLLETIRRQARLAQPLA
jgi:CheY-like chemotaxis protein/anti-sigma regulatory factor (Ser/Thr protein kinase)